MPVKRKASRQGTGAEALSKGASKLKTRSKATMERLKMYSSGRLTHDKNGRVTGGYLRSTKKTANKDMSTAARIQPDRRWFGNTRVIGATELDKFRDEMKMTLNDPYKVVLRTKSLPMSLLSESSKPAKVDLLSTESFKDTFGPKNQRKRPRLAHTSLSDLIQSVQSKAESFGIRDAEAAAQPVLHGGMRDQPRELMFSKGASKRIWEELYKVIDSSDVIIQVIDARDPMGTRSPYIENYMKKKAIHKHMILVLNKCDLVPNWCTRRWVGLLSKEYPTIVFKANIQNSYGKGSLIQLLRQFASLHSEKQQISVGLIGYPNVGKSSVINTLKREKVCKVAPVPGETKVWQYITLMKNIYLIDCPGVVYPSNDTEADLVLKGVVRSERLSTPEDYIPEVLQRVKRDYLFNAYGVPDWTDATDFLSKYALKCGRLLKGGDPDIRQVSIMVLNDFQRGKLPYFCVPPGCERAEEVDADALAPEEEGEEGEEEAVEIEEEGVENGE